ncbi:hypothetical protein ACSFA3_16460 [Variovorax sp. RHLX14]|uniref:hypothetical protein n=1 Tax=Variovorax sp. RHLX14 TaxID=1259731 RepID=UPI003F487DD4
MKALRNTTPHYAEIIENGRGPAMVGVNMEGRANSLQQERRQWWQSWAPDLALQHTVQPA